MRQTPTPSSEGAERCLRTSLTDFVFPLLMVGAMSLVLAVVARYASFELHSTLYLIPVIISAVRWGIRSAVVAALASVAVFDFFFLTPFYSFSIAEPSEVVDLAMFLVVALVTGNLAAALRREADRLRRRERDVHNLHLLSRRLALCSTDIDLVAAVQDYLTSHLGCQAFLIQPQQEGRARSRSTSPSSRRGSSRKRRRWSPRGTSRSRLLVDPDLRDVWALKSIATRTADHGVLAVDLGHQSPREAGELNDRVEAILSEAAAALERIDAARRVCQREPAAAVGFPQERPHRQRLAPAALADRLDPRLDQRARRHSRIARRRPYPLAGRRHAPRGEAPRQRHTEPARYRAHHQFRDQAGARMGRSRRSRHRGDPAAIPSARRTQACGRYRRRRCRCSSSTPASSSRRSARSSRMPASILRPGSTVTIAVRAEADEVIIDGGRQRHGASTRRGRIHVQTGVSWPPPARLDPRSRSWLMDCKDIRRRERRSDRRAQSRSGRGNDRDDAFSGS